MTQAKFSKQLKLLDTSPTLWKARQRYPSDEDKLRRQCEMGELCWLAAVSRPDICALLAQLASKLNNLQGSDIYRINDLAKTVRIWQPRTSLKFASSSFPLFSYGTDHKGRRRVKGERIHGGTRTLVGRPDAAYGDLSQNGRCRLGYVIGITSSSPTGPCHLLMWTSKFTRKLAESSVGGAVYAFSEMIDHMALLRAFFSPFEELTSGMLGLEDCESLASHVKNREMIAGKNLSRHFLGIQQFSEDGELDDVCALPSTKNPADDLANIEGETAPILSLLETGGFQPGVLRPLKRIGSREHRN